VRTGRPTYEPSIIFDYRTDFCSLFAAITLIFIFFPSRDTETGADKTRVAYLYERKDVVYENLRDLNFEYKAGKFTAADYDAMRVAWKPKPPAFWPKSKYWNPPKPEGVRPLKSFAVILLFACSIAASADTIRALSKTAPPINLRLEMKSN